MFVVRGASCVVGCRLLFVWVSVVGCSSLAALCFVSLRCSFVLCDVCWLFPFGCLLVLGFCLLIVVCCL